VYAESPSFGRPRPPFELHHHHHHHLDRLPLQNSHYPDHRAVTPRAAHGGEYELTHHHQLAYVPSSHHYPAEELDSYLYPHQPHSTLDLPPPAPAHTAEYSEFVYYDTEPHPTTLPLEQRPPPHRAALHSQPSVHMVGGHIHSDPLAMRSHRPDTENASSSSSQLQIFLPAAGDPADVHHLYPSPHHHAGRSLESAQQQQQQQQFLVLESPPGSPEDMDRFMPYPSPLTYYRTMPPASEGSHHGGGVGFAIDEYGVHGLHAPLVPLMPFMKDVSSVFHLSNEFLTTPYASPLVNYRPASMGSLTDRSMPTAAEYSHVVPHGAVGPMIRNGEVRLISHDHFEIEHILNGIGGVGNENMDRGCNHSYYQHNGGDLNSNGELLWSGRVAELSQAQDSSLSNSEVTTTETVRSTGDDGLGLAAVGIDENSGLSIGLDDQAYGDREPESGNTSLDTSVSTRDDKSFYPVNQKSPCIKGAIPAAPGLSLPSHTNSTTTITAPAATQSPTVSSQGRASYRGISDKFRKALSPV
jgi:hypothetical protein